MEGCSTDDEEDLPLHGEFDPSRNEVKKAEEVKEEKIEMATEFVFVLYTYFFLHL